METRIHGTCVVLMVGDQQWTVILIGPSGSGKSTLASQLIDSPGFGAGGLMLIRACLVSDDVVCLDRKGEKIVATSPPTGEGLLEVRGLGILSGVNYRKSAFVDGVVEHQLASQIERFPAQDSYQLLDCCLPSYRLDFQKQSAAAFLRTLALLQLRKIVKL